MRSLFIYLKNYKKETILAPLFKMLEASFELLVPLVMAAVIDKGIAQKDSPYIIRMCLVLIVLGIVGLICSLIAQYFSAKAAAGFGTGLRHALFEHIQHFGFSEMDEIGSSTLVTRMTSDVNQAQAGVNLVLRLFLRSPFIVFGAMAMSFMVDVKAAMVFVVVIPLLSVVVFGIMLITMPLYKKVQSYLDEILLKTRENLIGVRVLRAFNKEEKEKAEFEENNQMLTKEQKFVGSISGLMNPLTYIIVNVGIIVLIYVGAVRVNGESDSGGSSGSCQLYVADSCGACETGESDHYGDESGCMRKTDRSCVGDETGNAVGKFVVYRRKKDSSGGIFQCVIDI